MINFSKQCLGQDLSRQCDNSAREPVSGRAGGLAPRVGAGVNDNSLPGDVAGAAVTQGDVIVHFAHRRGSRRRGYDVAQVASVTLAVRRPAVVFLQPQKTHHKINTCVLRAVSFSFHVVSLSSGQFISTHSAIHIHRSEKDFASTTT